MPKEMLLTLNQMSELAQIVSENEKLAREDVDLQIRLAENRENEFRKIRRGLGLRD